MYETTSVLCLVAISYDFEVSVGIKGNSFLSTSTLKRMKIVDVFGRTYIVVDGSRIVPTVCVVREPIVLRGLASVFRPLDHSRRERKRRRSANRQLRS